MNRRRTLLLPMLLAAPIAFGACGGSDEPAEPAASSAVAAATTAAPATSEAAAPATSAEAEPATSMEMATTEDAASEPATTEDAASSAVDASAAVSKTTIEMGKPAELSLVVADAVLKAGKVTFEVTNDGAMEHEAIAIPAPDGLEGLKKDDGSAAEKGAAGEIELAPGESGSFTVELTPGTWALVCNKPGHFAGGMAMLVTVV